ncbi:hypothetical protein R2F61_02640 [Mollicutes bacterium LVI A0078]|nr:hypothetical protein RZE84_02670 [Mollicutes bacterium LVI A0075]WOO91468.1 hypothetical protein R2F61_02640 [Mollicutes bacterium LVI A0078]
MSPRMGVITTGIALSLSIILGVTITSTDTLADVNIGGFTGSFNTTSEFTSEAADSSTCRLQDDQVSITFTDGTSEVGSVTGTATLDGCATTVSGTISADVEAAE